MGFLVLETEKEVFMKTSAIVVLLICIMLMCSGCLFSSIRTPYDTNLDETQLGDKVGRASMHSILWLVAWGDASTAAAAMQGSLETINHMDMEFFNILFGVYTRQTTIVYGD